MNDENINLGGRPKDGLETLPDEWYASIIDLYLAGASDVEVKAWIYHNKGSFSNDLWDRWMKEEPQFSETIKMGKILSEAWWHKSGRINLKDKEFNYTGWYMQMKNRFGWRDSADITTNGKDLPNQSVINLSKLSDAALAELEASADGSD